MDFGFIFVHNLRARLPVYQLLCKVSQYIFKIEKKNKVPDYSDGQTESWMDR